MRSNNIMGRLVMLEAALQTKEMSDIDLFVAYIVAMDKIENHGADPEILDKLPPPKKGSLLYEMNKKYNEHIESVKMEDKIK